MEFATKEVAVRGLVYHTARVNSICWSSDNDHFASVGLDENIFIWCVSAPSNRIQVRHAHKGGANKVVWVNDKIVATCGQDCSLKTWDINY